MTEEEFRNLFEEKFQPLNFRDFSTKSLLEFACNVPDLIKVDVSPSGSYKFYPVSDSEDKNCGSTALAEVSENIKQLLEGHTEGNILFILINLVSFIFILDFQGRQAPPQSSVIMGSSSKLNFIYIDSSFLMLISDFYTYKKIVKLCIPFL